MKRLITTSFLICCLLAFCTLPIFVEKPSIPPFEERKEMAIDLLPDILYLNANEAARDRIRPYAYFDSDAMEWTSTELTVDIYPSVGISGSSVQYIPVDQVESHSPDLMMIVSAEGQPLGRIFIRYEPETGKFDGHYVQTWHDLDWIQRYYTQMEVFKEIKTPDSPICFLNCHNKSYIYGNTIYGKNRLLDINPDSEFLESPYFDSRDTGGIPLLEFEDFEQMILGWEDTFQYMGSPNNPAEFLPEYPHSAVVRNRRIFGTAGVLLFIWFCFVSYRIYRAKQEAKAE